MKRKSAWPLLPVLLALARLFAAFGIPRAVVFSLERSCSRAVTVLESVRD